MYKYNNLTETEYTIMKYLWSLDHDATAAEIREHFSHRNWSKQAVSTFLKHLVKANYLKMTKVSPTKFYYTVLISETEHNVLPVHEIVKQSFNGSYMDLFFALAQHEHLSDEAIARINDLLSKLE